MTFILRSAILDIEECVSVPKGSYAFSRIVQEDRATQIIIPNPKGTWTNFYASLSDKNLWEKSFATAITNYHLALLKEAYKE